MEQARRRAQELRRRELEALGIVPTQTYHTQGQVQTLGHGTEIARLPVERVEPPQIPTDEIPEGGSGFYFMLDESLLGGDDTLA